MRNALPRFDGPEVMEERNRRIANLVGKQLGYSVEKARDLYNTIGLLTKDPSPQKLLEFLYEKLWTVHAGVKRDDIRNAVTKCHEDALGWLQNTSQNSREQ